MAFSGRSNRQTAAPQDHKTETAKPLSQDSKASAFPQNRRHPEITVGQASFRRKSSSYWLSLIVECNVSRSFEPEEREEKLSPRANCYTWILSSMSFHFVIE
jgi:hypothetical protein